MAPPAMCRKPVCMQNQCRGFGIKQEKSQCPTELQCFSCLPQGLLWSSAFRVGDPLPSLQVGKTHIEVNFALTGQSMHGGSAGASLLPLRFYLLHPRAQYLSLTIVFIQPSFRHSRETPKLGMKSFLGSEGAWISTQFIFWVPETLTRLFSAKFYNCMSHSFGFRGLHGSSPTHLIRHCPETPGFRTPFGPIYTI